MPDMTGVYIVHFASKAAIAGLCATYNTIPYWIVVMNDFAFSTEELRLLRRRFTSRG